MVAKGLENKKKDKKLFASKNGEIALICPGCGYANILIDMKWENGALKCSKCEWRFRLFY